MRCVTQVLNHSTMHAGVTIVHELHRRRIFYSPWASVLLARRHPSLRFTAVWSLAKYILL